MSALDRHETELERIAAPIRLHRWLVGSANAQTHPAAWIDRMQELIARARTGGFDRAGMGAQMRELGAMLNARTNVPANRDRAALNPSD